MDRCINGAKSLIEHQVKCREVCNVGKPFSEFQKVYSWTNEYIKAYLRLVDFKNKQNALSVMASGDQTFNLISKGVSTIDTFDSNRLTEYYALGFKRAMILKYDYYSFLNIMKAIADKTIGLEYITELIIGLLPYMEEVHAFYWRSVIEFDYKLQKEQGTDLNLFLLLTLGNDLNSMTIYNDYLHDEDSYENLRRRLGGANVSFKCANAIELANDFTNEKYDAILLSNIPNYFAIRWNLGFGIKELQDYEKSLESIMNSDGVIFLNYIFNYGIGDNAIKSSVIGTSAIRKKDLTNGEEIYGLPSLPNKRVFDGIILKRVR